MSIAGKLLITLFLAAGTPRAYAEILVNVQQDSTQIDAHIRLTLTYTNAGEKSASIPLTSLPNSLKDGRLWSDSFQIIAADGSTPAYRGIHVNLTREARLETITLAPEEKRTVTVDITASYDLQPDTRYRISPPGVRYRELQPNAAQTSPIGESKRYIYKTSPFIDIVTPRITPKPPSQRGSSHSSTASNPTRCPPDKLLAIVESMPAARKLPGDTKSYLDSLYGFEQTEDSIIATFNQSPRYTTWFGNHGDPNEVDPVNITIREIVGATASRFGVLLQPSCDCPIELVNRVNAWTTQGINYLINYCPNFFSLPIDPNDQTGSRAVTIYHEVSHFDDFLAKGTSDYDASFALPSEAAGMARTDRDLAAEHAYGLEYFAKNEYSEE